MAGASIATARREKMIDSVVLYSTGCPKCKILKKKLDAAGLLYAECNDTEAMLAAGFTEVPMLQINCGKAMTFGETVRWLEGKTNG